MANMSFASVISASSNDGVASMNTSFASANQRTVYVHSPYTFTGPYEMVVPCKEEEEESFGNGSFCPTGSFSPTRPVCTSHMCNAAFAFHVSSCPLAQFPLVPPHPPLSAPQSPTALSLVSSIGSLSPEPRSPIASPTGPLGSPTPTKLSWAPLTTPTGVQNRQHKMLHALRQDSHQHLLRQLCGLQGKGPMTLESRDV
eukprot:GGOE01053752.1.p1 GENE.GGOE01053752.1~~GGOE01053752.1.p1  ORF type:complete len:212 (-),score=34.73 GGOE01053752.1:1505-2101(-)